MCLLILDGVLLDLRPDLSREGLLAMAKIATSLIGSEKRIRAGSIYGHTNWDL